MKRREDRENSIAGRRDLLVKTLRRAFSEFLAIPTSIIVGFLAIPTSIIVGFLLLSGVTYAVDKSQLIWLVPMRHFMEAHVFGDPQSTSNLLGSIASSLLTVTSITFSLLLIAVQQSAGSLSTQVFDQFLRRPLNQVYFGFFLGLALFSLITLATVNKPFNPLFGATVVLVMTIVALYLLILLIYSSIDQMRPGTIIEAIRGHILKARQAQLSLVNQTRRAPSLQHAIHKQVVTTEHGYLQSIDLALLRRTAGQTRGAIEVVVHIPVGAFVAFGDRIAEVRAEKEEDTGEMCRAVGRALHFERKRDIDTDPEYGVQQLATIAWTSISTAKSNPAPAIEAIRALRDVLARWSEPADDGDEQAKAEDRAPVVYPDMTVTGILNALESLTVAASESMQHQSLAELVRAVATLYPRLAPAQQQQAVVFTRRMISSLGDHVLTVQLQDALLALRRALTEGGEISASSALARATEELGESIGELNSTATRVPDSV